MSSFFLFMLVFSVMKEQISELAVKINALMLQKGLTRKELAAEIGVSAQFFIHIANGQMPAADKLVKLANALGVSAEWLLFGKDFCIPSWAIDLTTVCNRLDDKDKDAIIAFAEFYQDQKEKIKHSQKPDELDLIAAFVEFLKNRRSGGSRQFSAVIQRYQDRLAKYRSKHDDTHKMAGNLPKFADE